MWFTTRGTSFGYPGKLATDTGRGMRRKTAQQTRIARPVQAVAVVLAVGAVTAAAGCSGGSHTTTASSSTSAVPASTAPVASAPASNTAWNPCSISDADIAAAGLNSATKQVGALGVKFPGWDICAWLSNSWYQLNVYSTNSHTYDEVVQNTTLFHDPRPVTVGGRAAMLLPHVNESDGCTIAFDAVDPVQLAVSAKLSAETFGDPCTEVTRIAGVLLKDLPASKK